QWSRTTLLPAIELHRLIHLNMQARHELAGNFGNGRLMRIFGLFVSAAETDKAFFNLGFLRGVELQLRFVGEVLCDGIRAEIDAAGKDLALFEEKEVAG